MTVFPNWGLRFIATTNFSNPVAPISVKARALGDSRGPFMRFEKDGWTKVGRRVLKGHSRGLLRFRVSAPSSHAIAPRATTEWGEASNVGLDPAGWNRSNLPRLA